MTTNPAESPSLGQKKHVFIAPAPAPLDMAKLQDDLSKLTTSPASAANCVPIRYLLKIRGKSTTNVIAENAAIPPTPPAPPQLSAIDVTDLRSKGPRDRAVHWLHRALVRDENMIVSQRELYAFYEHNFTAALPGLQDLLEPSELVELACKIFKGAKATVIAEGKGGNNNQWEAEAGEAVVEGLVWKGMVEMVETVLGRPPASSTKTTTLDKVVKLREKMEQQASLSPLVVPPTAGGRATADSRSRSSSAPPSLSTPSALASVAAALNLMSTTTPGRFPISPIVDDDHALYTISIGHAELAAGRQLAHLTEPARTRCWVRMFFEPGTNAEVHSYSLWMFYQHTFLQEAGNLDSTSLFNELRKVFRNTQNVEVGPDLEYVVWGLQPRTPRLKLSEVLRYHAKMQRNRTLRHLQQCYDDPNTDFALRINPGQSLNKFQEKLRLDPVLGLPDGVESTWFQSRRDRMRGAPLGDYEKGYPGVSMRKIAKVLKRDCEAAGLPGSAARVVGLSEPLVVGESRQAGFMLPG